MRQCFSCAHNEVLGEFGESEALIPGNRLNYVVLANRRYGAHLGWQDYFDRILPLLGFSSFSPDEPTFAEAVASWQAQAGLAPDGMIGPATWARMRTVLGLATPAGAARPQSSPGKPAWVRQLVPLLNRYRGDIPLYFLLGWIQTESGGNITDRTKLDERGYFQIHPGESQALHLDHQRLSTDPDYSVQGGIQLVRYRAAQARRLGFSAGNELFWRVIKWRHWVPGAVDVIVADMKTNGVTPASWEVITQYVGANRTRLMSLFKARFHGTWDPLVGIANVNKVFQVGKQLAAGLE
jgi:peptidoglycan hydrolase-like protein with peptidoglycan-binding domain